MPAPARSGRESTNGSRASCSEAHHVDFQSAQFQLVGFLIPFVASAGSLISGYVSDTLFKGAAHRSRRVSILSRPAIILLAAQFHTANAAVVFLVLISFTANATHSILGTAAAMDIGGPKMAGFASGRDRFVPIFWR